MTTTNEIMTRAKAKAKGRMWVGIRGEPCWHCDTLHECGTECPTAAAAATKES